MNQQELLNDVHRLIQERFAANAKLVNIGEPEAEWLWNAQGVVSDKDILDIYAELTELPVKVSDELENLDSFPGITLEYLVNLGCLPVSWEEGRLLMAVRDPFSLARIRRDMFTFFNSKTEFVLVRRSVIERLQTQIYETAALDDEIDWSGGNSEEALQNLAKEAPVVRLVNDTFARALDMEASDIHIEPLEDEFVIRFRIDGVLQTVNTLPMNMFAAVASRVKLIGGMNIAEHRLPQDGRTEMQIGRNAIDVRISSVPATGGESLVMRILKKDVQNFSLSVIGMPDELQERFKRTIRMPHGIILVVGPTGSGKSTTLYCAMNILNTRDNKIMTVEDPVEYQIEGLTQVQVKAGIGLTFASALRAFLRQDPDIILVGEIRDKETAEIAINAALTGHLVLSTLHTNDSCGAISRLQDMGVENFLISSSLVAVLSQRLVRRICSSCHGTGLSAEHEAHKKCRNCAGTGFKGRVGIFEFLEVSDEIRRAVNQNLDAKELMTIACRQGMRTLREDGAMKAKQGVTTEAEVSRVCQLDS